MRKNIDFTYVSHPAVLFPQPTGYTCWYACASMILGLRRITRLSIRGENAASMNHGDLTREMVRERLRIRMGGAETGRLGGLSAEYSNVETFAGANGMNFHGPQTWSIDGLFNLVKEGPIAIMGDRPTGHAVVITAMETNGDSAGTTVVILDPWPPDIGRRHTSNYASMMRQFPLTTRYILQKPGAWQTAIVQAKDRSIRQ